MRDQVCCIIACMSSNRVIGKGNKLPWTLHDDLQRFRTKTLGCSVIMGRCTYESLSTTLSNRQVIVLSKEKDFLLSGAQVAHDTNEAWALTENAIVWIAGGQSLYDHYLPYADMIDLTIINKEFQGDRFFPEFNESKWNKPYKIEGHHYPSIGCNVNQFIFNRKYN